MQESDSAFYYRLAKEKVEEARNLNKEARSFNIETKQLLRVVSICMILVGILSGTASVIALISCVLKT